MKMRLFVDSYSFRSRVLQTWWLQGNLKINLSRNLLAIPNTASRDDDGD